MFKISNFFKANQKSKLKFLDFYFLFLVLNFSLLDFYFRLLDFNRK